MRLKGQTPEWRFAPALNCVCRYMSLVIRRTAQLAAVFISLAAMIGAGAVLSLAGEREQTRVPAPLVKVRPVMGPEAITATQDEFTHPRSDCKAITESFLDPACHSTELRKRQSGRSVHRVATVMIGRADPSLAPPAPAGPIPTPEVKKETLQPAHKLEAAPQLSTAARDEQSAASKQKAENNSNRREGRVGVYSTTQFDVLVAQTSPRPVLSDFFGGAWRSVP